MDGQDTVDQAASLSECVRITDFYDSVISMIHIEEFHMMPRSGV